jgi:hypothetical protein
MTVMLSSVGRVKPGRYTDFLSQAAEASKLYERLGTRPARLFTAGLAGEAFGTCTFSVEFDDLESFGALSDTMQKDSEAQALQIRLNEENSPSTIDQVTVAVEVPGRQSKGGRGSIAAIYVSKPLPGGLERSLEFGARAAAFAESQGAVNARTYSLIGAGSGTGMYLSMFEFDNMRSYVKVIEAFQTEPEGQAIATASAAKDSPVALVFEGVYSEIPI